MPGVQVERIRIPVGSKVELLAQLKRVAIN